MEYDPNDPIIMKKLPQESQVASIVIAIMQHKGGCGKTNLLAALFHWLSDEMDYKVLGIDCDPQCNFSQKEDVTQENIFVEERMDRFFNDLTKARISDKSRELPFEIIIPTLVTGGRKGIMVGSNVIEENAAMAQRILGGPQYIERIKERIEFYKQYYNFILVDTAPAIHNNCVNEAIINIADYIIMPFDSNESVFGMTHFIEWMTKTVLDKKEIPNIIFALTKFQKDTIDIVTKRAKVPVRDEEKCEIYNILRSLMPNHVCYTGIPERRVLRSHNYVGLKRAKAYALKRTYDTLCEEILRKIRDENIRDATVVWEEKHVKEKLNKKLVDIEKRRNKDIPRIYKNLKFREQS